MSDTKSLPTNTPLFKLNGLYVKDLSFENPGAPGVFLQPTGKPRINVSVDVFVNNIKDTAYEVALKSSAKAVAEDGKGMFIVEIVYAGLFVLNPELPREQYEKVLFVDCAQVIFPFIRRLVVDLSTEGGFPPVLLEPINLEAIYNAKKLAKPAA